MMTSMRPWICTALSTRRLHLIEIGYIGLYCRIVAQQKLPGEGHASGDVAATASGFGRDESCADCQRTARAISDLPLFCP